MTPKTKWTKIRSGTRPRTRARRRATRSRVARRNWTSTIRSGGGVPRWGVRGVPGRGVRGASSATDLHRRGGDSRRGRGGWATAGDDGRRDGERRRLPRRSAIAVRDGVCRAVRGASARASAPGAPGASAPGASVLNASAPGAPAPRRPRRLPRRLCPHRLRPGASVLTASAPAPPAPLSSPPPPPALSSPPPAAPLTTVDPAHAPTLECISSGMAAFDSGDFASAEVSFARATRFAAEGACPGPRAVRKCRSYALASRLLRHAATLAAACARGGDRFEPRDRGDSSTPRDPRPRGRTRAPTDARRRLRCRASRDTSPRSLSTADTAPPSFDSRRCGTSARDTSRGLPARSLPPPAADASSKRPPSAEVTRRCAAAAAAGLTPFGPARYAARRPRRNDRGECARRVADGADERASENVSRVPARRRTSTTRSSGRRAPRAGGRSCGGSAFWTRRFCGGEVDGGVGWGFGRSEGGFGGGGFDSHATYRRMSSCVSRVRWKFDGNSMEIRSVGTCVHPSGSR